MKSNIFIPEKINVGFQNRSDTYTKKLAYVIYYDQKGVLRKETSWNSWRDKDIENLVEENLPTSGFVLNKKAGGYSTGWNHRQTYVRVYDPRDFEFEITIANLLYILENTNSIKGKGLEGEFVYGWDGKDLLLIPTSSPDYAEIKDYNKIMHSDFKLKGKDLKLGATYLTKDNEEWIYLGRFDEWAKDYNAVPTHKERYSYDEYPWKNKGKSYYFKQFSRYGDGITTIRSLNKFIGVVTEDSSPEYAELMEKIEYHSSYSPVDHRQDKHIPYTLDEVLDKEISNFKSFTFYDEEKESRRLYMTDNGVYYYSVRNPKYNNSYWNRNNEPYEFQYEFESREDFFEKINPTYKQTFLANGKLYQEDK